MSLLLNQLFPERLDNDYRGRKLAVWLFGFVVLVKTLQMLVSIVNGYSTLRNADGIPIDTYPAGAAATILSLFALLGFTYLLLCIVCVAVLLRYRRAIPFMFALLLVDYLSRRVILHFLPVGRVGAPPGVMVNLALFILMIVGFALSLWPEKKTRPVDEANGPLGELTSVCLPRQPALAYLCLVRS